MESSIDSRVLAGGDQVNRRVCASHAVNISGEQGSGPCSTGDVELRGSCGEAAEPCEDAPGSPEASDPGHVTCLPCGGVRVVQLMDEIQGASPEACREPVLSRGVDSASCEAGGQNESASRGTEAPEAEERLEPVLENISLLAHLSVFAVLGVLIRYFLEVLFGPRNLHVTDDGQALFLDVPPNMLGSFLMGIVGFTVKKDIAAFSQPLAVGLSTGLCGSITTFASWNQRMMSVLAYGFGARAVSGYILGTAVAYYSFLVGVDTGNALKWLVEHVNERRRSLGRPEWGLRPEHYQRRWASLIISVVLCMATWITASLVFALDVPHPRVRKAALGCIVGPFGCWLRWYLSWFNGTGVGKKQRWKWVPVGTLAANLIAAGSEAVLSCVDAVSDTYLGSLLLGGAQLGFMGCLSTVSTLVLEMHLLVTGKAKRWRAYVYLYLLTLLPSAILGILFYCIPVWVYGKASNGYNKVDAWDKAYVASVFS